jgi:acyl dehydratase
MSNAEEEVVYTWDVMEIGHSAPPLTIEITEDYISSYSNSIQNDNRQHHDTTAAQSQGFQQLVAPLSMIYSFAPMRRHDIFENYGYVGPEKYAKSPRSTPFAGTETKFFGIPVLAGDTITSTTEISNRWETKSGNKFVSFKIQAKNQRDELVAEYLYNIIWERSAGQKTRI